jgi:PAS domain S-box-containing protein
MADVIVDLSAWAAAPHLRRLIDRAALVVGVTIGYYALAWFGTLLHVPPSNFAILWLATAYLVGVLLLTPVRAWWLYALGLVPVHFWMVASVEQAHVPLLVAATQIAGNLIVAVTTALAVRRVCGERPRFETFRGALIFIAVAGIGVLSVVNALILCLHLLTGWTHDFWLSWRQWMMASFFPAITITPLMVIVAGARAELRRQAFGELLMLSAFLFATTYFVFGSLSERDYAPTLLLAPLPFLLWAAARWGVGGASLALLVAAAAIVVRALGGNGPFGAGASTGDVLSLQVYLTATAVPLILLAALMEERRRAESQLRRSEARMGVVAASTDTGLWQWDAGSRQLWLTEECRRIFGLGPDPVPGPDAFLDAVQAEDRPRVHAALQNAFSSDGASPLGEFKVRGADGRERWILMNTRAERNAEGEVVQVSGVFRDDTQRRLAQQRFEQLSERMVSLQEEERTNIALALHDNTVQHLASISLTLAMLEERLMLTRPETRLLLDDMRSSLTTAASELRAFTYLLRPPELEHEGLSSVLEKYVKGFGQCTGVRTRSRLSRAADAMPVEQQRALLRVAQESLGNVYRHAAAASVSVALRRRGGQLHMVITDDGRGFPPASRDGEPPRMGVGIPGMTARIQQLGGKIDIRSGAKGARVHVVLPIAVEPGRDRPAGVLRAVL